MKVFLLAWAFLGLPTLSFAQPDLRDSIILEYKTVSPIQSPGALTIKVWITNKDSLSGLVLPVLESSFSGGAYVTLSYPRTFEGVVATLNTNFTSGTADFSSYHSDSPDTLLLTGTSISLEPPNSIRKAIWEIKFDTVKPALGCVVLDSILLPPNSSVGFVDPMGRKVEVNFVKGHMLVDVPPALPGFGISSSIACCSYYVPGGVPPPDTVLIVLWVPAGDTLWYDFGLPCPGEWTFSVVSGPGSIDSNGAYTFPPHCQAGLYPVTFQVSGRPDVFCGCDIFKVNYYTFDVIVDPSIRGDLNCDRTVAPSDVVLLLQAVFLGQPPPAGMPACDFDCGGGPSPSDGQFCSMRFFWGERFRVRHHPLIPLAEAEPRLGQASPIRRGEIKKALAGLADFCASGFPFFAGASPPAASQISPSPSEPPRLGRKGLCSCIGRIVE